MAASAAEQQSLDEEKGFALAAAVLVVVGPARLTAWEPQEALEVQKKLRLAVSARQTFEGAAFQAPTDWVARPLVLQYRTWEASAAGHVCSGLAPF